METKTERDVKTQLDMSAKMEKVANPEASADRKKINNAVVGMAGAGGAVAGGAAGVAIGTAIGTPDVISANDESAPVSNVADFDGSKVPVATHVNDQMKFGEAFSSARDELGAGGVFFWRGNPYNTYTADEWNQFPQEYKTAFSGYRYLPPEGRFEVPSATAPESVPGAAPGAQAVQSDDDDREQMAADVQEEDEAGGGPVILQAAAGVQEGEIADGPVVLQAAVDVQEGEIDGGPVILQAAIDVQEGEIDDGPVVLQAAIDGQESIIAADGAEEKDDAYAVNSGTGETDVVALSTGEQRDDLQGDSRSDYLSENELPDYANDADVSDLV